MPKFMEKYLPVTLKHFYANNVEWRRCYDSVDVSEKVKYDYELEPYRYLIEESHAEGVMAAYNGINGVTGMLNHEIQNILKDKWGMKHAVCDGGAFQQVVNFHHDFETHAETLAESVKAGVDNMLDNPEVVSQAAKEAYDRGLISEEEIDKSLICMFESRIRLGAFDEKDPYDGLGINHIGTEWAIDVSKKMSEESNVLLKNEDKMLPLDKEDDFVLIGPYSDVWYQDWYCGLPLYRTTIKDGIEQITGKKIQFENGLNRILLCKDEKYVGIEEVKECSEKEDNKSCDEVILRLVLVDCEKDAAVFEHTNWGSGCNYLCSVKYNKYVKLCENGELRLESENPFSWYIFENLTMVPAYGVDKLENPQNANMIEFSRYYEDDESEIRIYGFGARPIYVDNGVIKARNLHDERNADQGVINKEGQNMAENYKSDGVEAAVFTVKIVKNGIKAAIEAAKKANKVILAFGNNPVINAKEEIDRKSIEMIPYQEKLFEKIVKENQNTAVILMTNYPYAINKMNDEAKAILMNATGSQDMGYGIASALFGISSPAGRVPMTWYKSDNDLPDITDYDLINNKRTYRYFDKEVLYPFGYGLTYSMFLYKNINVKCNTDIDENALLSGNITRDSIFDIEVTIKNIGDTVSDEVVQVYIKRISESMTVHPLRRLIGFERIHNVVPGETKNIKISVKPTDISIYAESFSEKIVEPGEYLVYAGANALDEQVSFKVVI